MTIQDLLFKTVLFHGPNGEDRLILVFCVTESLHTYTHTDGSIKKDPSSTAVFVDIYESINLGILAISDFVVNDTILEAMEPVDPMSITPQLISLAAVSNQEYGQIMERLTDISKMASVLQKIVVEAGDPDQASGQLLGLQIRNLFRSAPLNPKEVNEISMKVSKAILDNKDLDLSTEEGREAMKRALEFAVIESLPPSVSAEDINLDMNAVIAVARNLRKNIEGDTDDE